MPDAVAYLRVSSASQAEDGVSIEDQGARATVWCEQNGYVLREVFLDRGASAFKGNGTRRPAIHAAMAAVGPGDVLLVHEVTRWWRNAGHGIINAQRLWDREVRTYSLSEHFDSDTPEGRFMWQIFLALGELSSAKLSKRNTQIAAHLQRQGMRRSGHAPYGYAFEGVAEDGTGGTVVEEPGEQATIARARELREAGGSLRGIASQLEREGRLSRAGKRFSAESVRRMLAD